MTIQLDYFYGNDIGRFKFLRTPKLLFEVSCYLGISFEARMFFSCLLDRVSLSMRNGLTDRDGRVFIFFTIKEAMQLTGYGHNKVEGMFKELEKSGLIERKAQGLGKPARIYVKNFRGAEESMADAVSGTEEMEQLSIEAFMSDAETTRHIAMDLPEDTEPMPTRMETAPAVSHTHAEAERTNVTLDAQTRPETPCPAAQTVISVENFSTFVEKFCPVLTSALVNAFKSSVVSCGNVENFSTTVENSRSASGFKEDGSRQTSAKEESRLPKTGSLDFPKQASNYTDINNTDSSDTYPSIHRGSTSYKESTPDRTQAAKKMNDMKILREVIEENIDYPILLKDYPYRADQIDEYVNLMVQTCCSDKPTVRINREEYPQAVVRSCFEKLNREHIIYVMDCMAKNVTKIRNIRAYTLSVLFNSYSTIEAYYQAAVNYDTAAEEEDDEVDDDGNGWKGHRYCARNRSYAR